MGEYFSKLNWPQITNVLIAVAIWLQFWLIKQQVFPKTRMHAHAESVFLSKKQTRILQLTIANLMSVGVYTPRVLFQYGTDSGWSEEVEIPVRKIIKPFDVIELVIPRTHFPKVEKGLATVDFRVRPIFHIRGKERRHPWEKMTTTVYRSDIGAVRATRRPKNGRWYKILWKKLKFWRSWNWATLKRKLKFWQH